LRRIWTNIAHPFAYKTYLKTSFWSSFWYVYWLVVAMIFVSMAIVLVGFFFSLPSIRQGIAIVEQDLPALYPAELVVMLKDGEIRTNMPEPYSIDLPPRWQEFLRGQKGMEIEGQPAEEFPLHFITFDSKASVEDYSPTDSLILVTRTAVVMPDKQMSYRVISVDQAEQDFTMNVQMYDDFVDAVSPFIHAAPTFLVIFVIGGFFVLPFIGAAFLVLGYLLYLLVFVLLAWIIAAIMSRKAGYGDLYKLSLNALTAPLLITFAGEKVGLSYPYLFSLLTLGWMIAVLWWLPGPAAHARAGKARAKARKK